LLPSHSSPADGLILCLARRAVKPRILRSDTEPAARGRTLPSRAGTRPVAMLRGVIPCRSTAFGKGSIVDFKLQPHEEAFRQEVRDWITAEFGPNWDGGGMVSPEAGYEYSREVNQKLAEKGWLAPAWPKEYGGMGAGYW